MADEPIVHICKKEEEFYKDIGEALLKYCRNGAGSVYIDDVKMLNSSKENGWMKAEFYFKVVE